MNVSLVDQNYWDTAYEKHTNIKVLPKGDGTRKWIEKHFQYMQGTCIEIGCFPGTYLAVFGELGYELHGIDLADRVETDLPYWLRNRGYRIGRFARVDFFDYEDDNAFDVVCSFGFIEHFVNWEEVLVRQAQYVKNGGYLVIQTPNFRGPIQRLLHILVDRENYDRHYIRSMRPKLWRTIVQDLGFETVYCGYFGKFKFWFEPQHRNILQKTLIVLTRRLLPILGRLPDDQSLYSPYCGLIARKRLQNRSRKSSCLAERE